MPKLVISRNTPFSKHDTTQVKLFVEKTPDFEAFEKKVNDFLHDERESIVVKDIKYTVEIPNLQNSAWQYWTAMVIYEKKMQ